MGQLTRALALERWEAGRIRYGGLAFVGEPVRELLAELLDGMNYCDEAMRRPELGDKVSKILPIRDQLEISADVIAGLLVLDDAVK